MRLYWPPALRPAFDALMGIDAAMADVVATTSQPALGAIRLAWWREALEKLDDHDPPAEPRLIAAADHLLPLGLTGRDLSGLEAGWAALLNETLDPARVAEGGATLFALAARLLGGAPTGEAGRLFALVRALRLGVRDVETAARQAKASLKGRSVPRTLRPVTLLARLAARDLGRFPAIEPAGTPGRAAALLAHRLTGKIA